MTFCQPKQELTSYAMALSIKNIDNRLIGFYKLHYKKKIHTLSRTRSLGFQRPFRTGNIFCCLLFALNITVGDFKTLAVEEME